MLLREVQTKLQPVTADADLFWCRELHVRTQYSRSGDGSGSESHPLVGFRTQSRSGDGSGSESHPLVNSMSVRSHGLGMSPGASRTLSWVLTVWGWVRERVAPSRGVPVSPTVKFLETATTDVRRRPQDFFLGVGNEGV